MRKQNANKYHHYIPQCYLRKFAHKTKKGSKQYYIYCFDKYNGKSYENNIRNVCGMDDFYRIKDETCFMVDDAQLDPLMIEKKYFAEIIEPNYTRLLNDLQSFAQECIKEDIGHFPNDDSLRLQIAKYIAIQYLRQPSIKSLACNAATTIYPQLTEIAKRLVANIENDPKYNDLEIKIEYDNALIHAQSSFMNEDLIKQFASSISQNYWTFMYSSTGEFMTNDSPILLKQHENGARPLCLGLAQYGVEMYFVFSPFLVVQIYDRQFFKLEHSQDFLFGEVTDNGIKHINLLNYCTAQRHVFSFCGDFSFVERLYNIEHNEKNENAK